ncbi:MAG: branched-chain amino acid ABC transporter permease, partial [bacterium]|nr:branched-chain amino acid ABC transporter permease [bacterium]
LTASFIQFLHPSMFWLPSLIAVLTALILGGVGSLGGSLAGVAILTAIGEGVRFVPFPPEYLGALRLTITALILLGILLFRPRGLFGKIDVR